MKWTQKELEELYQKANEKAKADPEFRKAVLSDAGSALEELAGRKLPEGFSLELVESDNSYASAYLVPNFTGDEIDMKGLRSAANDNTDDQGKMSVGVSFVLIISVCAAAASVGPCGGNICGGAACAGDACAGNICGGAACSGNACAGDAICGGNICAGNACAGDVICGGAACAADACAGDVVCGGNACAGNACAGDVVCGGDACGGYACGGNVACGGNTCGGKA